MAMHGEAVYKRAYNALRSERPYLPNTWIGMTPEQRRGFTKMLDAQERALDKLALKRTNMIRDNSALQERWAGNLYRARND